MPFCPSFGQIFRHFEDGRSSSTSLYPVGCKRHLCMFTCSVDQGGCKRSAFRFLPCLQIRTVVVYYTQVSQVCIEGTELWKRYGKKEMKKMCHLFLSERKKKDSLVSLSVSKPSARASSCGSRASYCLPFLHGARFRNVYTSTVSPTLFNFVPPPKRKCSFLTVPRSKLYDPPKWWNQGFVTLQLA